MGALFIAIAVWRHEIDVRRADELAARTAQTEAQAAERAARADQARLVILEFQYDEKLDMFSGGQETYMHAVVSNLSNRPVFDVEVDVPDDSGQLVIGTVDGDPDNPSTVRAIASGNSHKTSYEHVATSIDWGYLGTTPVVRFTDANGVRWTRSAASQPAEVIPSPNTDTSG